MAKKQHQPRLSEWNRTDAYFPPLCVHQLFEAQAEYTPDELALMEGQRSLTYAELNQQANQIAQRLRAMGCQPDDLIGICIERSSELFIGLLGVLKAGCAYVPLDANYPAERIDYMLRDSGASILLTTTHIAKQLEPNVAALQDCQFVCLDKETEFFLENSVSETLPIDVSSTNLAYCIYTSGSTGNPKGTLMEHRSLVNMLWWHNQTRPSVQGVCTLQFCAVSFDFSFHEIFSTLCLGGTLVLVPETIRENPFALAQFIQEQQIEKLFLPVTALLQLAEAVTEETMPTTVREVITTGEQMRITPAVANLFRQTNAMLHNHYGATEFQDATTYTLTGAPDMWPVLVPVGTPISNVQVYILDEAQQPVPIGEEGEFCIGGAGVARGYHNLPELNAQKFIDNPFGEGKLYRAGDLARYQTLPDGTMTIEHLGRMDHQVKIRGFRVELGEIETALAHHPAVGECAVVAREMAGDTQLVGYVVLHDNGISTDLDANLRAYLAETLPEYMVPTRFVPLDAMPLTPSGKLDRRSLPTPTQTRPALSTPLVQPKTATEKRLAEIWQAQLGLDRVGSHDNFFELGGTSLLLTQAHKSLRDSFDINLSAVSLFQYPTIQTLAHYIDSQAGTVSNDTAPHGAATKMKKTRKKQRGDNNDIAIIGMAGRFPGAETIEQFWQNLCDGVESITFFDDDELEQTSSDLLNNSDYVKAGAVLDDIEMFDPAFFGYSPKEAAITDPQQRILLECAWEAFEYAGYNPETYPGAVGVYAGSSLSTYLLNNISASLGIATEQPFIETDMAQFQAKIGNDRSYLATRISYKLNLTGPSINVQTACSTSLVAVHMACQSLISGESDMALAGGISVVVPHKGGYLYEEGMVRSPDGHCRAFDADAQGTIFGNGGGLVLLKRLQDALDDNDNIVAVIKGTAINNDGALKMGYTAPSVNRQADVIAEALAAADVDASTIGYVEAHGTATKLGDPIEVAGLTQAFQHSSNHLLAAQQCAIGSVKTNIGHLDEAAGIAGLIKAALAVQQGQIPPSLHFSSPNPQIDFDATPFFVNTTLRDWSRADGNNSHPRRAGVSSFGVGGTNSHVVLEEAPFIETVISSPLPDRGHHLLALSAPNQEALHELTQRYIDHLENQPDNTLGALCFTANTGRKHFEQRLAVVAESVEKLSEKLAVSLMASTIPEICAFQAKQIVFLFTGQGAQYVNMGRQLYDTQPVFRETIDLCDQLLRLDLAYSLLEVLYPDAGQSSSINETAYTQPALFAVEYALYQLWKSWGIEPDVVMGHSVGEYVAACVAGVFCLEDGLKLIAERGRLMQALPKNGKMLSVAASETLVTSFLAPHTEQVSIAALNGPESLVLSGLDSAIDEITVQLTAEGINCKELTVSHAFHSPLMTPMLADFESVAQQVGYDEPQIKFISNITGLVASQEFATPDYWVRHVRQPVQFLGGMECTSEMGADVFIEIGPQPVLLGMGRRCLPEHKGLWLPSLHPKRNDWQQLLTSLADLYRLGVEVDWESLDRAYTRRRQPLPTYPFQRKRCWIEAQNSNQLVHKFQTPHVKSDKELHPLLGHRLDLPGSQEVHFHSYLSVDSPGWMKDHRVFGSIIAPGVSYLEMVIAASQEMTNHLNGAIKVCLKDVGIHQPLIFSEDGTHKEVHTVLQAENESNHKFQIFGYESDETWLLHASGTITADELDSIPETIDLSSFQIQHKDTLFVTDRYRGKESLDLGPSFWVTEQIWQNGRSGLGQFTLPEQLHSDADRYYLHPALMDAGLLALLAIAPGNKLPYIPVFIERVHFYGEKGHKTVWCQVSLHSSEDDSSHLLKGDVKFFTSTGQIVASLENLLFVKSSQQTLFSARESMWKEWVYNIQWRASKLYPPQKADSVSLIQNERWLILVDEKTSVTAQQLGDILEDKGVECIFISSAITYRQVEQQQYQINPEKRADFEQLLASCGVLNGIIYMWAFSDKISPDELTGQLCNSLLHLIQALVQSPVYTQTPPSLWLITAGGQHVNNQPVQTIAYSALWGMGKVVAAEHTELNCVRVDLDSTSAPEVQVQMLADEIFAASQGDSAEEEIAYRDQIRYVPRLTRYTPVPNQHNIALDGNGTYLITGGMGELGLQVANFLVDHGARHLVLVGRSVPSSIVQAKIAELENAGAEVALAQVDVAQFEQMSELFADIDHRSRPLRGIIHAAGVLDDSILQRQTTDRFARVMAPKVQGAWNLHQLTIDLPLDFFVLFSSVTSLLGTVGQSNYAAANAFLDGLASYRQGLGLPCLSINWGSWSEVGMTARLGLVEQLAQKGEGVISPQQGIAVFGQLLGDSATQIGVMPIDWPRFLHQEETVSPFYQNFVVFAEKASSRQLTQHKSEPVNFRQQLDDAPNHERPTMLQRHIRAQIAGILGIEPSDLPSEENVGFVTLGMDSLTSIELRNQLQRSLACALPITFAFDYGTVKKVIDYLTALILAPMADAPAREANPAGQPAMGEPSNELSLQKASEPSMVEDEDESLDAIFMELAKQIGK